MTNERREPLSAHEAEELSERYTLFDWAAQLKISPIPVPRAEDVDFRDTGGKPTPTSTHSS